MNHMKYTNIHGLSLPIAVWLLYDDYDYVDDPKYISATSLMVPTKQFILGRRVPSDMKEADLSDLLARSMGNSIHAGIEKAWTSKGAKLMELLGYPKSICDKIAINPDPEYLKLNPDTLPVYIEQRTFKEFNGYLIGGKFDTVIDGRLFDNKSTSVWGYLLGSRDEQHAQQGGIYRWLNPDKIIDDYIYIQYIFTDWQKAMTKQRADYPKVRALEHPVEMLTLQQTEEFIKYKIDLLEKYKLAKEEDLPECTDEELWRSEPQYKYYSDPTKTSGRSTRNFDNLAEANKFLSEKGKGIVITKPGEVKRCSYCAAAPICQQRLRYITNEEE